jgi:hypothetical protein
VAFRTAEIAGVLEKFLFAIFAIQEKYPDAGMAGGKSIKRVQIPVLSVPTRTPFRKYFSKSRVLLT